MSSALEPQYVHGVYIPSTLLVMGCAIVKMEWVPYAVAAAAVLGGWKVYSNGENYTAILWFLRRSAITDKTAADRKVLKPNEFQEFELKEKTILSHNTAM